ncbi:MAG: 2Fe-2S iron-sulfur cluster binding domain-containing protein [Oscillospiraceae bacterium]|nr:2Fe-2S iron-sulfur cluster binding domain-containing protein [Oscillospiraceae bacterium]
MKRHKIILADSGESFVCEEEEFILRAMFHAGCGPLHNGCCGGGCGICKMQIVEGAYHVEKKMSRAHISGEEAARGILLLCCVKPRSDLTIRTIEEEKRKVGRYVWQSIKP